MNNQKFRKVAEDFFVAPQLLEHDFQAARAMGIKSVINNRPDGEEPGQISDAQAQSSAHAAGLNYIYVPVISGGIFPDHIALMRSAIEAHKPPFLAYCRSGTRSCYLWSFVAAQRNPPKEIIAAAARAGYDLQNVESILGEIYESNKNEGHSQ